MKTQLLDGGGASVIVRGSPRVSKAGVRHVAQALGQLRFAGALLSNWLLRTANLSLSTSSQCIGFTLNQAPAAQWPLADSGPHSLVGPSPGKGLLFPVVSGDTPGMRLSGPG